MPRLIDPGATPAPIALDEAIEALIAMRFDPEEDGAWDAAAPILAVLSAWPALVTERSFPLDQPTSFIAGQEQAP